MKNEIWKPIKGYEGYYEVSNLGRVRSLDKIIKHPRLIKQFVEGKYLSGSKNNCGYIRVFITKNNNIKTRYIHRLVALHFIPNPHNKRTVNHKNGIKTDNRLENLEWATYSENMIHSFETGLRKNKRRA